MEKSIFNSSHSKKAIQPLRYLSRAEARAIEKELLEEFRFGPQQLIEIWGHACAMAIAKEYEPTIFYPKRSSNPLYRDFTTQCEKMDIPFLSYLPTEVQLISDAYNLVVDAILGVEASLGELLEPYCTILATLKQIQVPLISLDVPSGWDAETGSSDGISPDVLVSLAAPKQCATRFMGKHHLVAGRFLPYDIQKKFELNMPEYPGTECVISL
uniref:YjeF N-terminal domain-containing protein 3 isoform X3 n=1 Tax=Pogona vitticeps TaxID=103695 RepID=A0ABM5EM11_9SAUR